MTTITVAKKFGGERVNVEAWPVVDGLAITPSLEYSRYDRFALTHVPSGLAALSNRCRTHIDQAAELVRAAAGIDWTVADTKALVDAIRATTLLDDIKAAIGPSCAYRRQNCEDPDEPSWGVRCNTCDWEFDEYDEGPLDVKEAKRLADDHECEPRVELQPPDGGRWVDPWSVNDDGTIRTYEPKAVA